MVLDEVDIDRPEPEGDRYRNRVNVGNHSLHWNLVKGFTRYVSTLISYFSCEKWCPCNPNRNGACLAAALSGFVSCGDWCQNGRAQQVSHLIDFMHLIRFLSSVK